MKRQTNPVDEMRNTLKLALEEVDMNTHIGVIQAQVAKDIIQSVFDDLAGLKLKEEYSDCGCPICIGHRGTGK